jgi:hypothetical protein
MRGYAWILPLTNVHHLGKFRGVLLASSRMPEEGEFGGSDYAILRANADAPSIIGGIYAKG